MADTEFPKRVLGELESHCLRRGRFDAVNRMEPDQAPGNGITAAIWVEHIGPARGGSGLASTTIRLEYRIRLYTPLAQFPQEMVDLNLLEACADLMSTFTADFTLDGGIRAIDLQGIYGEPLNARAGYLEQDSNRYRIMTITVPVVVNDVWDQAE